MTTRIINEHWGVQDMMLSDYHREIDALFIRYEDVIPLESIASVMNGIDVTAQTQAYISELSKELKQEARRMRGLSIKSK